MLTHIRPAQLADWLADVTPDGGPLPLVLDVREPWEMHTARVTPVGFELRHLPMASIPLRLAELPADRLIACLCHHGARSAQVAHFLLSRGYPEVVNIQGGIDLWSDELDPTVPRY